MYSPDEKRRAIEPFIKHGCIATAVAGESGYPSRGLPCTWHRQYQELGEKALANSAPRYDDGEKRVAVEHHLGHGRCLARTMRMPGYPKSGEPPSSWVRGPEPGRAKPKKAAGAFASEQGKSAVIDPEAGRPSAGGVARRHGVRREPVYSRRGDPLGKGGSGMDGESPLPPTSPSRRRKSSARRSDSGARGSRGAS